MWESMKNMLQRQNIKKKQQQNVPQLWNVENPEKSMIRSSGTYLYKMIVKFLDTIYVPNIGLMLRIAGFVRMAT